MGMNEVAKYMVSELNIKETSARVWMVLQAHRGRANAISQNNLAHEIGLGPRTAREVVKHLIENEGRQICSAYNAGGGYYLPETQDEIEETRRLLRSHAISIFKRCKALGVDIKKLQMELFGGDHATR